MPKRLKLEDLKITEVPKITVIAYNCRPGCTYSQTKIEAHCKCVKYYSIKAGVGECYRISSGNITGWKEARLEAQRIAKRLSPEVREARDRKAARVRVSPIELFDLYLKSKENGATQRVNHHGKRGESTVVKKVRTVKKILEAFLAQWHQLPLAERVIEPGKTLAKIDYADQITTYWLEHAWRPTWFKKEDADEGGSFWSITKRLELVQSVWHFGQKNKYLPDQRASKNCECVAHSMMMPKKQTKTVQPTPPFTLAQYAMVVATCALYEQSIHDRNRDQLRITNERLRAIIEVMRYCGPRILDASLMRKDGLMVLPNGKIIWTYVPVKNGDEANPIQIPVPRPVYELLMSLPEDPNLDPRYFFWSGISLVENASDPYVRALRRLFRLCPAEARKVFDARNKQKRNPSSHMFRNTFCVQCRLKGMTYAQIADAIGDNEQTVRDHYSAYCLEYDAQVNAGVESMQNAVERMQNQETVAELLLPKQTEQVVVQNAATA